MAKTKSKPSAKNAPKGFLASFDINNIIPGKYHIPVVILVLIIFYIAFLNPLFLGGKSFQSGDIIAAESSQPYLAKDRDGFTLWNPHVFCGMPAYSISVGYTWFNIVYVAFTTVRSAFTGLFGNDYVKWAFYVILLAINSFFLFRYLTKNTLVSVFGGIAASFSTGLIVFLFIGHVTKLTAICMYPLIFLMLLKFREGIKITDFLILTIALQLLIQGFHLQIIFYILVMVGVYYLYFLIYTLIRKHKEEFSSLLKSAGALIAAIVIAFLIQADNFTQIWEYTPYSTRGGKSVVELSTGKAEQSASEYYDYHTNWSFSPGEVMTFIIPSYFGFGNTIYNGPLSQNQDVEVNTYFGQMPFVDVAMYMGVLIFFLGLYAIFTRYKEPLVQYLTALMLFALLISFGKNFSLIFDILFYNLPYFDKFRVPSMALVIVQLVFPILAVLGVMKIISLREERVKRQEDILKYAAYLFTGLFVITILLSGAIGTWFTERVQESARAEQLKPIYEYMSEMFIGDALLAFSFTAIVFWAALGYVNRRLSKDILVGIIILLTVVDLWRINNRGTKYIDAPEAANMFTTPDYVSAIRKQNDTEPFRIMNMKQDGSLGSVNQNSNFHAYFLLEDFYGYSAVKPRAFQDMMDVVGPVNLTLWRMANVKYVISEKPLGVPGLTPIYQTDKTVLNRNDFALGRLYFSNSVEKKEGIDILNAIKNNTFDPAQVTYVDKDIKNVTAPDSTASIKIVKHNDEHMIAEVNATGNNFIVFATTYYPVGWKAYIDGKELEIVRANHMFNGVVVPKGNHKVEFEFLPKSFVYTKTIALILSSLVMGGLVITLVLQFTKKKKAPEDKPQQA